MQRVLITGGAGFIGSHLCKRLLDDGYEVICVDNLLTGNTDNLKEVLTYPHFRFEQCDVLQPLSDLGKLDAIFHLASPASPNHHSKLSYHALPMETMLVNTQGTMSMAKLAKEHNAKFLFTSTSEVYGDPLEHPQKETYRGNVSTTGPRSVYDEAKRFGETIVSYFVRDQGLDGRIARIFNTYGPNMSKADMRMIIIFITQALEGKPITVFGNGMQTRSLCYASDTVDGLVKLMFSANTKGEVVNIGAETEHTVLEYANITKKLANSQSEIVFSEGLPEDDPMRRKPDITKAKQLLEWEPKVSLEDGLKNTMEYFKVITV